ncbi:MAG: BlaI/MecI/CopY family transcriptional regulator [Pirellulales bacterium]
MAGAKSNRLGELQLEILKVLWRLGPASVAEVHAELAAQRLAYTTVATMLRKMEDRGLVRHRNDGRRFIYEAALAADDVKSNMAADFVHRLCDGRLAEAMCHLLDVRSVSRQELLELERMIQERKAARRS